MKTREEMDAEYLKSYQQMLANNALIRINQVQAMYLSGNRLYLFIFCLDICQSEFRRIVSKVLYLLSGLVMYDEPGYRMTASRVWTELKNTPDQVMTSAIGALVSLVAPLKAAVLLATVANDIVRKPYGGSIYVPQPDGSTKLFTPEIWEGHMLNLKNGVEYRAPVG